MSWLDKAFCRKSKNKSFWLSFDPDEIQFALDGCSKCEVIKECAMSYEQHGGDGVMAGTTDFTRLKARWREAVDINDDNWS